MKKILLTFSTLLLFVTSNEAQENYPGGKELFGDIQARHIGPALMSGRFIDLEAHPTNNRILFAGAAGGGVWKTINGGATFSPVFDKHAQSIGAIKIDPTDPDKTVWVGTGEIWTRNSVSVGDGLYKSTDGGINWTKKGFENSERISAIAINPTNNKEMYVAVMGALWGDSEERGIYKSNDAGETWQKVLYTDKSTGAAELIIDPKNPNILYASMWKFRRTPWGFESGGNTSAIYKSLDAGKTWNKIHNGFPDGNLGRIALALAPSDSSILYAAVETESEKTNGLYKSTDAGASWKQLNNYFGLTVRPFYFARLVVDPKNPDILVKGGLYGSISRDGGKTFQDLGPQHSDIHDIVFDLHDSNRLYTATDGGVYRSWDAGSNFEMVQDLPVSQFYHVSVDDATPYKVYGGLQDNQSWYGPSSSPGGVEARDWNLIGAGDGFRVLKHATKPIIYSEMQGAQNVWRFNTELNQAKNVAPPAENDEKLRFNWNAPMALSVQAPDRFYMGSQYLHKSEDMGDTWIKISPDLTTNDPKKQDLNSGGLSVDKSGAETHTTIFTIAESTLDEKIIWVGTDDGNVQITRDGGKTWNNVVKNISGIPANTWVYHIEASVHNPGTAYVVFDGHSTGDMNTYVCKTSDYGLTWESIVTSDIKGFARNIQEDYEQEDLLFLGTEFGLFITTNGGKHWSHFTNNLPEVAVHYIELQKRTSDLVLGTHGRGIIILDDISPLRQINDTVLDKDMHFFKTSAGIIKEESGFGGTSTETEFVGQNPSSLAKIMYYMKKRHTFGKMSMQIRDLEGNLIAEPVPGKSKGINTVNWDYLKKAPKVAVGKIPSFVLAPKADAGDYKVSITKGKETYEHTINVKNDPNSMVTDVERTANKALTLRLFNIIEDLAYLGYRIDSTVESLKDTTSKNATKAVEELTALKAKLVITTGDRYVQEAEPELREKLNTLYNEVAGTFEKPAPVRYANADTYEQQVAGAWKTYTNIEKKYVSKINAERIKNGKEELDLDSKEVFLAK
ncbi:WD40/YVTN/BNR-like repeat-containing protein [Leeuwenhoekiella sp. NPDC079379]|uniref:WD40/YVTN/BNR-like repeat-containing protein n=1 Tax=Leeuwenhoekiella sp. NPDC079379 TaxID=3364122 RepID=UPI0037CCBC4B